MKALKKTTAAALILGMLLTSLPYAVFADGTTVLTTAATATNKQVTQDEAVELAKKYFPSLADLDSEQSYYESGKLLPYDDSNTWEIMFVPKKGYEYPEVEINADTGALVSYDDLDGLVGSKQPISRTLGKQKADAFLKQFAPDTVDGVQLDEKASKAVTDAGGISGYEFHYVRTNNGIAFPDNFVTVTINNQGELKRYQRQWTDHLQFPTNTTPTVTLDQAQTAYRNALDVRLSYEPNYGAFIKPSVSMIYELPSSLTMSPFPMIDAQTGQALHADGTPYPADKSALKPLTEQPGAPYSAHQLTREEAIDIVAKQELGLEGFTLQHTAYAVHDAYHLHQNLWTLRYTKGTDANDQDVVNLNIDAKTGELVTYRADFATDSSADQPTLTLEQTKQKAIETIKRALPTQTDQLAFDESETLSNNYEPDTYTFSFRQLVNGIPVDGESVNVTLSATGKLIKLQSNYGDKSLTYPAKDKAISLDAAKDKFIEKYPLQLSYVPIVENGQSLDDSHMKIKGVVLAYTPQEQSLKDLDAVTGTWPSSRKPEQPPLVQDIKGHWAEYQLRYFADIGAFAVTDGNIHPDEQMTRGDALSSWMWASDNDSYGYAQQWDSTDFTDVPKTDPNYNAIEEAYNRYWLSMQSSTFRPNDKMTRAELAELAVRSIGEDQLAQSPHTFQIQYSDVSATSPKLGFIAVATALGLMAGNNGKFAPDQPITKAQLAVVMWKVLDYTRSIPHNVFGHDPAF